MKVGLLKGKWLSVFYLSLGKIGGFRRSCLDRIFVKFSKIVSWISVMYDIFIRNQYMVMNTTFMPVNIIYLAAQKKQNTGNTMMPLGIDKWNRSLCNIWLKQFILQKLQINGIQTSITLGIKSIKSEHNIHRMCKIKPNDTELKEILLVQKMRNSH